MIQRLISCHARVRRNGYRYRFQIFKIYRHWYRGHGVTLLNIHVVADCSGRGARFTVPVTVVTNASHRLTALLMQKAIAHEAERIFKIVLAGDAAVGKSSFILRLCKNKFVANLNSTLGA